MSTPADKRRHWLFKSEPDVYSIHDLERDKTTCWEGVRNYQARNLLRDEIQTGDLVFFYHSNANPPAIAGMAEVCRSGYPDHTAWDQQAKYYDPKGRPGQPTWFMVDIRHLETFAQPVTLTMLKQTPGLEEMMVTKRGTRLSVQPVTAQEWKIILGLARQGMPSLR